MTTVPRVLGLFAKWPAPGRTKTRLVATNPALGALAARAFLCDSLDRFGVIDARRVLAFEPPIALTDFAGLAAGRFELEPQGPGDLGARLSAYFARQVAGGARAIIAVGSDSPTVPIEFIEQAFTALETADVVIGPATDGGYYLIGCGRRVPPVFNGIRWGQSVVLAETLARLTDPNWRVALLPPWYDVDTADDWSMLCGHIAALRRSGIDPQAPHTERLLGELGVSLSPSSINEPPYEG
jgi:rSAM/selenodomain-associated transferase 1